MFDAPNTAPDQGISISNRDFLSAVFRDLAPDETLWVNAFRQPPGKDAPWGGRALNGFAPEPPADNTYFSVAAVRKGADGRIGRRFECFSRLFVIVLDDTPPPAALPPTWVLETSRPEGRSNTQVGYRLSEPVTDIALARRLHDALARAGHIPNDKSGNNPVRWVRLPLGSNTKHNPPHPHRLLLWEPDRTVTVEQLVAGLGLEMDPPQAARPAAPSATSSAADTYEGESYFAKVNQKALRNLSAWVPALLPAAKPYHGGYRVASKDLGRNLEEDLSILSEGIKDFGEEKGKTAIDLVLDWGSPTTATDAALWLCGQMGVDPAALGWRTAAGSPDHGRRVAEAIIGRAGEEPKAGDEQGEDDDSDAPISIGEAEALLAWSWRSKTPLPGADVSGVFVGERDPRTGKPIERLRVRIQEGADYTGPWIKLAWDHGADGFIRAVDEYLPRRADLVERANLKRIERGRQPKDDMPPAALRAHAHTWLARVRDLEVDDATGRALLARVSPPWPDPMPLPAALRPVAPFDMDLLPAALRPWIADIADRMQCPPDFAAVGAMVALSSVIGRKAVIRPKRFDDWVVVPNLWGAVVGRPGIMKSPALAAAIAPLERLQTIASEAHKADKAAYQRAAKLNAMADADAEKKAQKLVSAGKREEANRLLMDNEVAAAADAQPPVLRRYKVIDTSVEALGETLIENPWGTLAYRDELHGLLTSMDKEGQEGARSFYLQSYDATQSYTFDRIVRGRNLHIEAPCLAMLGGIQPGKIKSYIRAATSEGKGDDGLLQRFSLIVWPDIAGEWIDVDRLPDSPAKTTAFETFSRLDAMPPDTDPETDQPIPRVYRFTDDAQEMFGEWRAALERRLRSDDLHPAVESHLSKYRKLVPALALVCALADQETAVSAVSLARALDWADYLETHAHRVYAAGTGVALDAAAHLLAKIRTGAVADGFKPSDAYLKGWTGLADPAAVTAAADILCDLGHLREVVARPGPHGGRPSVTYQINPATRAGG